MLKIEMPLNPLAEKRIIKTFNFFEIINGEKIYLSKDFMLEKREEATVDDVTGKSLV
jgi:hypothetical protein